MRSVLLPNADDFMYVLLCLMMSKLGCIKREICTL